MIGAVSISTRTALLAGSRDPLWIQAAIRIRAQIDNGNLPPGSRLPPERELCVQLNVSRVTLRKALAKLVEDGALTSAHGRGWYVAVAAEPVEREWPNTLESFTETAHRMHLLPRSRVLRAEVVPATLDTAELLAIAPGKPLFQLERVRLLNEVPVAVDVTQVPLALAPELTEVDFSSASMYQLLGDAGLTLARADSTIEARGVGPSDAPHLDLEIGDPILLLHQVVVDEVGVPVLSSTIKYSGMRYRLRTSFTRAPRISGPTK